MLDTDTGWVQEAMLRPSDGEFNDQFGNSVSCDGARVLIGAPTGQRQWHLCLARFYLFGFDGTQWTEETKLTPSDGASYDQFGISVSLDGDRALIGAHEVDDNGSNSGSAYVFAFNGTTWWQEAKLTADDGMANDQFGISVSLDGTRALVGAHLDDDNGSDSGSAYVFYLDGINWLQEAKLTALDGEEDDLFGFSVSLDGNRALIGADQDDVNGFRSGSAYVFASDGQAWSQEANLIPTDGEMFHRFGRSVSLSGTRALVGASWDDDNGSAAGSAYLFFFRRRRGLVRGKKVDCGRR